LYHIWVVISVSFDGTKTFARLRGSRNLKGVGESEANQPHEMSTFDVEIRVITGGICCPWRFLAKTGDVQWKKKTSNFI